MNQRLVATYRVRSDAGGIDARAQAIAVEQSVEMPLDAIDDAQVLDEIVGRVEAIEDQGGGQFAVRIGLAAATVGTDAGQLLNMLFGNTSLHEDVSLIDVELPPELAAKFGGPCHGIAGLRARAGAADRALTCSAIKPQGLAVDRLAALVERFARGGLDFVKDDHGLADQAYPRSPTAWPPAPPPPAAPPTRPATRRATSRACRATSNGCAARSRRSATRASTR